MRMRLAPFLSFGRHVASSRSPEALMDVNGSVRSLLPLAIGPRMNIFSLRPRITDLALYFTDMLHDAQNRVSNWTSRGPGSFGYFLDHGIHVHSTSLGDMKSLATLPYPELFHSGPNT